MARQFDDLENSFSWRISDLDDSDKPREKAMTHGIGTLSNAELLAIILGSGLPGKSVIALSQEILASCNNRLSQLSMMSIYEMTKNYKGVGAAKAISLAAAFELGLRARDETEIKDAVIRSSNDIYNVVRSRLQRLNYEEFWVLYLSRSNRIMFEQCLSKGGVAGTVVDTKLILKRAIELLASSIILVHNHPSGNLRPSREDEKITTTIKQAAALIDVKVLDHLIITPFAFFSFLDEGLL